MEILKTDEYEKWFRNLRDISAKARINAKIRLIEVNDCLVGDYRPVGEGVVELRFHMGPGYRVYMTLQHDTLVLLLIGGDKSTQECDIGKAKALAREWSSNDGC